MNQRTDALQALSIKRAEQPVRLSPDPARVIARPFIIGGAERLQRIADRVLAMGEEQIERSLADVRRRFGYRHRDLDAVFRLHYGDAARELRFSAEPSEHARLLIGAYFTCEYAIESVALFNPSIVAHPEQAEVAGTGSLRFVMSLRACGEGHVSSIEFREGVIDASGNVSVRPPTPFCGAARPIENKRYDKPRYTRKLQEMGAYGPFVEEALKGLEEKFTFADLSAAIDDVEHRPEFTAQMREAAGHMRWLAHSNYQVNFAETTYLSERVIFPISDNESRGIEDARFVRFVEDDGEPTYYATYTAYNGLRTLPQLLSTKDFESFRIHTLNGTCVQNKGMALFPRRIGGNYMMAGRIDGENIYLMSSDHLHFWNDAKPLRGPIHPWEFVQIGNCGSPIETDRGWILLTHGVGPMREYFLGAILLDLDDPSRIAGHLPQPLIVPEESHRNGYVPNVVYSCGGLVHAGKLILPYALADTATAIAVFDVNELLDSFE